MVMLVISLLLASEALGLFPKNGSRLVERKFIVETLAVHVAMEMDNSSGTVSPEISELLRNTVQRNKAVKSVAIRQNSGNLLDVYGSHDGAWTLKEGERSTPTQVQVPLFEGDNQIANVEIRFGDLNEGLSLIDRRASFPAVLIFTALSGFMAFCFFLKRTLRELDPDAVIPERVKKALDTLAEGLLIINRDGEIVFSNEEFASTCGIAAEDLAGQNCNSLNWQVQNNEQLPWVDLLNGGEMDPAQSIKLKTGYEQLSTFTVNATPIIAGPDEIKGALVTFNDITEVEIKNTELENANAELKKSQVEIKRQNEELEYLATRDPLTGSLNRRSFFSGFDSLFSDARQNGEELSCVMTDIDHFKSVNDTHGHGVGDDVIKYLANVLADHARSNDLVGRFGGEEFCMVMPDTTIAEAAQIAEDIRIAIEEGIGADFFDKCQITASFGVASILSNASTPSDMVEQSDKALYYSKENGRNQVTNYTSAMEDGESDFVAEPAAAPAAPTVSKPAVPVLALKTTPTPADTDSDSTTPSAPPIVKPTPPVIIEPANDEKKFVPMFATPKEVVEERPQDSEDDIAGSNNESLRLDRSLLMDRLQHAVKNADRGSHKLGLMLVSIEALHRINDTLGFTVSEKLYRKIVRRLKNLLRAETLVGSDISVSRYGDTEVCLTLNKIERAEDLEIIHANILEAFDRTFSVDGHEIYVALDTGISVFPENGEDADKIMRSASVAMRTAKETDGQNNVVYFQDQLDSTSRRMIKLETGMHQALARNELFVVYQPKVDLRSGHIVGMEALLRWRHREMGIISPGEFIPIAETTGLINDISAWVTRVVCAQVALWREAGHTELTVSVNISPAEMRNDLLANNILGSIREFGIPPSSFEVEITESMVMEDMVTAVATLDKLNRAGVDISIDDFGTGFASLSYLKQFPINKVKIDRLFVSDFEKNRADARIVSGVIAMSHSLGLIAVCEGVEDIGQLRFLQDNHCDQVQGNLLGLPLQRQEATNLLANPGNIRRIVTDYKASELGLSAIGTSGISTVINGVLNEFPSHSANSDLPMQANSSNR